MTMHESPTVKRINSLVENASRYPWAKNLTEKGGYCEGCGDWWSRLEEGICRDCRTRVTVMGDRL